MDTSPIPDEMADAFARDGVAVVRAVLDPAELASAALAIDIVLANPGPMAKVASTPDDPGSFTEDFCPAGTRAAPPGPWPASLRRLPRRYRRCVLMRRAGPHA